MTFAFGRSRSWDAPGFPDDGVVGRQDEQRRTDRFVWAVVIAAALVAGAAAGLAKGFSTGWPVIAAVIIGGVGAVAWPISNVVKAQLEQRQKTLRLVGL
jgi:hypothetical protein